MANANPVDHLNLTASWRYGDASVGRIETVPVLLSTGHLRFASKAFMGSLRYPSVAPTSEMPRLYAPFSSSAVCFASA